MDISGCAPLQNSMIDQMTMELLCNRSQYKRYLAKTDTETYETNQAYLAKIEKYYSKLKSLTDALLLDPEKQITNDVNNAFNQYIKVCFHHVELKEMEERSLRFGEKDDAEFEDETLFGQMDLAPSSNVSSSFWGKQVIRRRK